MEQHLRSTFTYDPETGLVFRNAYISKRKGFFPARLMGWKGKNGYMKVTISHKSEMFHGLLHRLAWFLHYNKWPTEIDHINRKRDDNRIANLRDVDHSTNRLNSSTHDNAKHVRWSKGGNYWEVIENIKGKIIVLGGKFKSRELAEKASYEYHHTGISYEDWRKKYIKLRIPKYYVYDTRFRIPVYRVVFNQKHIGTYKTLEEAQNAIQELKDKRDKDEKDI